MGTVNLNTESTWHRFWNTQLDTIEKPNETPLDTLHPIQLPPDEPAAALDKSVLEGNIFVRVNVVMLEKVNGKSRLRAIATQAMAMDQYKQYHELLVKSLENTAWLAQKWCQMAASAGMLIPVVVAGVVPKALRHENLYGMPLNWLRFAFNKFDEKKAKTWEKQANALATSLPQLCNMQSQLQQQVSSAPSQTYSAKSEQSNKKADAASGAKKDAQEDEQAVFNMANGLIDKMSRLTEKTTQL
jgi:hypothetical protein